MALGSVTLVGRRVPKKERYLAFFRWCVEQYAPTQVAQIMDSGRVRIVVFLTGREAEEIHAPEGQWSIFDARPTGPVPVYGVTRPAAARNRIRVQRDQPARITIHLPNDTLEDGARLAKVFIHELRHALDAADYFTAYARTYAAETDAEQDIAADDLRQYTRFLQNRILMESRAHEAESVLWSRVRPGDAREMYRQIVG